MICKGYGPKLKLRPMKNNLPFLLLFTGIVSIAAYSAFKIAPAQVNIQVSQAPVQLAHDEPAAPTPPADTVGAHIQLVFALDATGSMSGLIGAAKEKIWSIASSLSQAKPAPVIEVGMIFYRDRGDAFVTKVIPLSNKMDEIYSLLMDIKADGGGDQPESVNQGLYEAVYKMQWSTDDKTIKNLFLVGDCPPHMDYKNDVKYYETCKQARKKGITINTILMGNNSEAKLIWQEISRCAEGEFLQMDMQANNFEVHSPYDNDIQKIQEKLDLQRMYYGTADQLYKNTSKKAEAEKLNTSEVSTSARRADYNMSNETNKAAYYGSNELLYDVQHEKVKVEDIKEKELPEKLKGMTTEERKTYVAQQITERQALEKQLLELTRKRQEYIQKELEHMDSTAVKNSFNNTIYNQVQKQALDKGYRMEGKAKF